MPVRISNVAFVTSADGINIGNTSSGSGENIAILRVTADNWANTNVSNGTLLRAELETFEITSNSTRLSNLTVERLGVGNNTQIASTASGAVYTFDMAAAAASIKELDRQQVAYFLIRGDLDSHTSNYTVRVSLEDLNGGSIEFRHDGSGTTIDALHIGQTRVESPSITVQQ